MQSMQDIVAEAMYEGQRKHNEMLRPDAWGDADLPTREYWMDRAAEALAAIEDCQGPQA